MHSWRPSDVSIQQVSPQLLNMPNQAWLEAFVSRYARAPRVLMIGNIANNAYNNAKILNQAGLDCDVICYDYYHVMGCPEWEDADLSRSPKNDFWPNWVGIQMGGYERPRWFAQGPVLDCIDYLISRRKGADDTEKKWRTLLIRTLVSRPRNLTEALIRVNFSFKAWSRPLRIKLHVSRIKLQLWINSHAPSLYFQLLKIKKLQVRWMSPHAVRGKQSCQVQLSTEPFLSPLYVPVRARELVRVFGAEFPYREDKLSVSDTDSYAHYFSEWKKLLGLYDIVIGFSTDPFIPLLCEKRYFAVEHGTLRDIPFAPDGQGRRTALAYRLAEHCFVTNFDCAANADKLAPGRYTLINHPYDEDHGLSVGGADELRDRLQRELDCDFLFFHPTRQDWVEGTGYADKRNEVFLHAFGALRRRGLRVGLVICAWGANVAQSRRLLAEVGSSRYVRWTPPLAITPFERMCKACDVVVDQFKLGAFGGVVFKAMAVGTPIVTFLNEVLVSDQYSELPPVINCQTAADIESAIESIVQDPIKLSRIGKQSRDWIYRHHGKRETINKQMDQFRRFLPIPSTDSAPVVF
jgi:glycosyltransferase involved in cell wall biosynthesis